ncbi:MAG: translation initiation factor IF-2 [Cryomorphaceae bacterium]|jgi:translation initiation factor IF-2|nr:translation initiation factor IF-2 [Cryomorphaceae bacterium]MBT6214604.1 translation initiation factor IF-2 [Cryomorphaceae bacterium]MBT7383211.1 translation initiation factor IF-2 [Cryomorphaceae bacterium]MBT7546613.1 translation initiation factor IF-2 [Cryomorphaceae bacterium]
MPSPIRLNKVLKELNISLDRAVEFLSSKKIEIEPRPTSKIDQNTYDLLLDEFQTDKSDKDKLEEINTKKRKELEAKLAEEIKEEELKSQQAIKKEELKSQQAIKKEELKSQQAIEKEELKSQQATEKEETPIEKDNTTKKEVSESPSKVKKSIEEVKVNPDNPSKIQTNFQKLTGLKKTGEVIDLDSIKKKEEKVEESKKKRRKRISKDVSKPKDLTNKFNKNNKQSTTNLKVEPTNDEIQKQIRETLEKLQGKSSKSKGAKYRKDKRDQRKIQTEEEEALQEKESKIIKITEFITVGEIATLMDISSNDIISTCMSLGIMVTMNQRLDAETLSVVADEFGYELDFIKTDIEEDQEEVEEEEDPKNLVERPPIVTVMGHVDHGKTSLLDFIRKSSVTEGESGGITQHIGAYSVAVNSKKITFLDTPGHEAFTAMRARGAQITDIVIIVIAADDNIMPQTKEAISHAQAGGVPIIFAINKVDKEGANPDKVKESLASMNLVVEDWGGKIQSQDISALKGQGIDSLLEKVLLEAEIMDLKANPNKNSSGSVLEAYLDKGRGYVSTILVQNGSLKIGDYLLAGKTSGKVKAMFDESGNSLKLASPSTPVSVLGLDGAPQAGDPFKVLNDEKEAKMIASKRTQLGREQDVRTQKHLTLDEIGRRIAIGDFKELNVIIKGDVDGSVEALTDSFQNLSTEEIQVNIILKAVGAITESDVLLASASEAIIVGFNVKPTLSARKLSEKEQIDIRFYSIIYDAINDLKDAMEGMLSLEIKEESTGEAEVRETFKISRVGTIAGCMVTSGKIFRNSSIRVVRADEMIFEGKLLSLKRFKDDVKEVAKGYDCGIQVNEFNDLVEGDIIQCYQEIEVKRKL